MNCAVVESTGIVTLAGTVIAAGALLDSAIEAPPAGAPAVNVTVHEVDAPAAIVVVSQLSSESWGGGANVTAVDFVEAPRSAVITAFRPEPATAAAVATNEPLEFCAGMVSELGTASFALFDESATAAPPVPATRSSVTTQFTVPAPTMVAGLQTTVVIAGVTAAVMLIVLPTPVTGRAVASTEAATTPVT